MTQRHHYQGRIIEIDRKILNMGTAVGEALQSSIVALQSRDAARAKNIIANDDAINRSELEIQDDLTILIAKEQPVAKDLRHIITSLKIIAQLERMGDHAVHIAKETVRLAQFSQIVHSIEHTEDIAKMADTGVLMLKDSLRAFGDGDYTQAEDIAKMDDSVDNLRDSINRELLTTMLQDASQLNQVMSLMFVTRWLERFADHVTNICEWVVYDCTGKHLELNL